MRPTFLLAAALAVLAVTALTHVANGDDFPNKAPQIIVLKLDDVVAYRSSNGPPVPPRWQRLTDFLQESDIKASYGIIGFSLEEDNQAYSNWIKNLHASGLIEFWNHGYRNRKATDKSGEFEGSFEEQRAALERTQRLAKEKLGIELKTFGPHWSGTNEDTARALEGIPEIKMWFYGPNDSSKFVFERVLTLENPIFVPDAARFRELYEKVGQGQRCLALQGHPNAWDDQRWESFVQIIDYLKSKGCVFMTPSEYMEKVIGPSTTAKTQVTQDQALKLAKAAAERDLNAQAGEIRIELDDKPTIADNEDAWAFTWQGTGRAGGYVVTVRVDHRGEVRILQSKIGSNRD